ncbi:MAG: class I SAM-dependent methyltransferase [Actinomycetota bacterium]|nr:class I SAM-dependent methyltransferase [Actinomycetota bacterium]
MPSSEVGVNLEQARAWDGSEGANWTDNEDWYNAAVRYLTPALFSSAAIEPAEHVLDIGCGTGETTRMAAREAASGATFGIDLSRGMIERARRRAAEEGLRNIRFERGDAQVYPFEPGRFDVAVSRNGTMFFDDPVNAFANIANALKPGGSVVMLCWRELARNEWVRELRAALAAGRDLPEPPPHAPSPFALANPERVRAILTAAGFDHVQCDSVEQPIYFGPDAATAFAGVTKLGIVNGLLADVDDVSRRGALERLRDTLGNHETAEGVLFDSSAWIVRATKALKGEES